jgi:hypothetical protein
MFEDYSSMNKIELEAELRRLQEFPLCEISSKMKKLPKEKPPAAFY